MAAPSPKGTLESPPWEMPIDAGLMGGHSGSDPETKPPPPTSCGRGGWGSLGGRGGGGAGLGSRVPQHAYLKMIP